MKTTSYYLLHRSARVHCLQWGTGQHLLIALHSFADRARVFSVLERSLGERYTVVAFDLPFHGQTEWPYETFDKSDMLQIIEQIRLRVGRERLSLMGFSFGARIAQGLLADVLPRLERLFLLAPDGIRTQGMWWAVHTPLWLRRRFRRWVQHPAGWLCAVGWGQRLGLVSPLVAQFLRFNLARPERRQRVFGCWLALDSFYVRRHTLRALWANSGVPIVVFLGATDETIHRRAVQELARGLPNVQVIYVNGGHRMVGEIFAEQLAHLDL
jgi:pimeloyl-ACP methyl ester carboxylesterase